MRNSLLFRPNPNAIEMLRRTRGVLCIFTALIFVVGATRPASATWRAVDAPECLEWLPECVSLPGAGRLYSRVFVTKQGGTTHKGLWTFAEEIEVAEDAYYQNPTTANKNMVQSLCDGFIYLYGDDWSVNKCNYDLGVANIAFARPYNVTGLAGGG